jgi:ribonuclease T1
MRHLPWVLVWLTGLMGVAGCVQRTDRQPVRREAAKASASRSLGGGSGDVSAKKRETPRSMTSRQRRADLNRKLSALQSPGPANTAAANPADPGAESKVARGPPRQQIADATIKSYDNVVYRGPIDLRPTIRRILAGERDPHRNDGGMFGNREGRLPKQSRSFYREYVHRTAGIDGAGPQRLIVGRNGQWWYTADHYKTFIPLQ